MKYITTALLVISLSGLQGAYAAENYDLKCQLTNHDMMTLSHSDNTVYIAFIAPNDDPEEGGHVIKLDIASNGAQQSLGIENFTNRKYFVLRGTDEDIEGAISVTYSLAKGKKSASYSVMTTLGKETENLNCLSDSIKVSNDLLASGLSHVPFIN
ncbi:hypothetical protein [Erwinia rhapontici]|uniref:hypothetical protein n=1 Tax=Erwinia rhapontici TaxID=55212 RepID=UPI002169FF44|nr:hypothetical protein [Erwinia rhapontici]MCS3608485.1 hypothetical protein [Erwinia rhapontici]